MKHPATRTAAVGLATAAVLSGALVMAAPATAQDLVTSGRASGPAATAEVSDVAKTSEQVSTSGKAADKVATATYSTKAKAANVSAAGTTFDWGFRRGWWILNLNGMPVSAGQSVTVSATEVDAFGNEFVGGAQVYCTNVAVTQNRVSTRCLVDWASPLHVRLHYVY